MPIVDHNKAFSLLSIVTVLIISTLFLNLFVGVVIETYNMQKEIHSKDYMLKGIQKQWITITLMVYRTKPVVL
jgi:competence protein ComGC